MIPHSFIQQAFIEHLLCARQGPRLCDPSCNDRGADLLWERWGRWAMSKQLHRTNTCRGRNSGVQEGTTDAVTLELRPEDTRTSLHWTLRPASKAGLGQNPEAVGRNVYLEDTAGVTKREREREWQMSTADGGEERNRGGEQMGGAPAGCNPLNWHNGCLWGYN